MTIYKAILSIVVFLGIQLIIHLYVFEIVEWLPLSEDQVWIGYLLFQTLALLLAYTLVFAIFFKSNPLCFPIKAKFNELRPSTLYILVLLALGLLLFDRPFIDLYNSIFYPEFVPTTEVNTVSSYRFKALMHRSFLALIIAPIFEELLFRKYLFGNLLKRYSLMTAMITSSLLFASIHLPDARNLLPTFIFGIISCLVYIKTKNLFYCIFLHFLGNLLWLSNMSITRPFKVWLIQSKYSLPYWAFFVSGVIIVLFCLKKLNDLNSPEKAE